MRKYVLVLCGVLSLTVLPMIEGQVTSSGGVANAIPKYTSPTALTSSAITDASGTVTLTEPLVDNGGSTGSGTSSFSVTGYQQYGLGIQFKLANLTGLPESGSTTYIVFTGGNRPNGFAAIQSGGTDYSGGNGFLAFQSSAGAVLKEGMRLAPGGNVGIGTTAPGAKLEVDGNLKLTAGSGASVTFADGTIQSTAWNGTTLGGDYAESVDVLGDRAKYEPGDLIAIDTAFPGKFMKAGTAYSRLVAGVYSTKPGLVGRRATYARPDKAEEVPMAMMGIVPVKVTAENGPIEPGDLLVSSSVLGYAMKGTDRDRMMGATIGKALAPLDSGEGLIEVLISLQ
jgi:hypothetical protein